MIWALVEKTGWHVNYVLWQINWPTLILMTADAPRWVKGERTIKVTSKEQSDALFAAQSNKFN
jgi:hypothetical protein